MSFSAIGLVRPKDVRNIGSVLRAATCYGARMVAIEGERVGANGIKAPTDTTSAYRSIPVMRGGLRGLVPYGATPVAVELVDGASSLVSFAHPACAFYIFGPEDGTLGSSTLGWCPLRVFIPTTTCMNLAATVNVVLYDRMAKQHTTGAAVQHG